MEVRFGKIIVQQVDCALKEEPGRDSLLILLKIAEPALLDADLTDTSTRESALRSLKLLVHPDKHPSDPTSTKRFQDTQAFYDQCCARSTKYRRYLLVR